MSSHLGRNPFQKQVQQKTPQVSVLPCASKSTVQKVFVDLPTQTIFFALKTALFVTAVLQFGSKSKKFGSEKFGEK